MNNHTNEHKNLTKISHKEILAMFISSLVIGFIINFRPWFKAGKVELSFFLISFIAAVLSAFAIIMIRVWAQKFIALKLGYITTYTVHKYSLPASIFIMFFINGLIPFVSPGELKIKESKRLRLGSFRYGLSYQDIAIIGLAAPVSTILLMLLIKPIFLITNNILVDRIIQSAAAITFFGMMPIAGQEGFSALYYRRWLYVMSITFIIIYFLLILTSSVFSYIVAAVIAVGVFWLYQEHIN